MEIMFIRNGTYFTCSGEVDRYIPSHHKTYPCRGPRQPTPRHVPGEVTFYFGEEWGVEDFEGVTEVQWGIHTLSTTLRYKAIEVTNIPSDLGNLVSFKQARS